MKSDSFICETESMHNACLSAEWFQRIVKIILSVHNMWGIQKQPSRGVFLGKGVLRICSKFTGEYPCRSAISIKPLCNFIEITLLHGCSPVNLLHILRTPFLKNISERLLLHVRVTCNYFMPSYGESYSGAIRSAFWLL